MCEIFFNGIWRMDWGLGNPNKTAALIAGFMVAAWGLAYVRKWGFWAAFGLFLVLGICLIHTFSRGGLVAALAGLVALLAFVPRPWPLIKIIAISGAVLALVVFACHLDAQKRYGQGVIEKDPSIANRVRLWKAAPVMMVDAPGGWGLGNAGNAFMRWYQPTDRNEQYRSLVNSHLTWLVEFGWPLRFLYLFAWASVFLLCLPPRESRWYAVPLGIWVAVGVAACFSSVAESMWLWIVPGVSLAMVLGNRLRTMKWPRPVAWSFPFGVAALACMIVILAAKEGTGITGSKNRVIIGNNTPLIWLVTDERTLGRYGYAKSLREYLAQNPTDRSVGIAQSLNFLPKDLSGVIVVIAGLPEGLNKERMLLISSSASKLLLLSPGYYPHEAGIGANAKSSIEVFFGEFSQSNFRPAWEGTVQVRRIAGVGDYIPIWPEIVFAEARF